MDDKTLRNAGIALGGGALAVAVAIASMSGGGPKPAPTTSPPETAAPTTSQTPSDVSSETPTPGAEPAAAAAPPPRDLTTTFIVRFKPTHPLGKAQALAEKGRLTAAKVAANKALTKGDVKGLCFERFTLGGAETVLRLCADTQASAKAWLTKLRASPQVEYADANVTVDVEKK